MSYFVDPKQRSDAEWFCEEEEWNETCFDESRGIQESKEVKQNVWYFNYPFSSQFTPKHILCICILYLLVTSSFSSFCLLSENNIKAFAKILNNKYLIHFFSAMEVLCYKFQWWKSLSYYIIDFLSFRHLIQEFCYRFNQRMTQYSLRGQLIAYYNSILRLLKDFPNIR